MKILPDNSIFKKNDIRGIVGKSINPELFMLIGKAYSKYIIENENNYSKIWVSVGYDARPHSQMLCKALIEGLTSSGINVINLGLCPTPLAYFSEFSENKELPEVSGSLIITASHNPPEYNGLKFTYKKNSFNSDQIIKIKKLIENGKYINSKQNGKIVNHNIIPEYIESISRQFDKIDKNIKIVVDSGNATAGIVAPELYRQLGCEVIDIFSEPDSNFPNHHPNPSNEKNLIHLREKIKETNADFGIAFDGDSDRIGVIDNTGNIIQGDQLLLIFALNILENQKFLEKKPVFISEVKCSKILFDEINRNGGHSIMWKTGHSFIKSKMKEENALLAGEMSGHIFFNDRFYGFDDAIYSGCRLIEILAQKKAENSNIKLSDIINRLPKSYTTPEIKISCPEEYKAQIIERLNLELEKNPNLLGEKIEDIITIDGLRIIFKNGFSLIRCSNTEPIFTLRFENITKEGLESYKSYLINAVNDIMEKTIRI